MYRDFFSVRAGSLPSMRNCWKVPEQYLPSGCRRSNQTILVKPVDVSDYNVWKKNLKALSTSAFKNSQVRLGVDY